MGVERKTEGMEKLRAKTNLVLIFGMPESEMSIFGQNFVFGEFSVVLQ